MADYRVGLGKQSLTIQDSDVQKLAAALDVQMKRDLKPAWGMDADVFVLENPDRPPDDVMPIFIRDHTPGELAGIHTTAGNALHPERARKPWAVVSTQRDWRLAASHECLEMLVDPTGVQTVRSRGLALRDGTVQELDVEFEYLLEICDPIEDNDHAYDIEGVVVSDFYTPSYFDAEHVPGRVYSINGAITRPREVRPGGYLSWHDPKTGKLQQLRNFSGYALVDLAETGKDLLNRKFVDQVTHTPRLYPEKFANRAKR